MKRFDGAQNWNESFSRLSIEAFSFLFSYYAVPLAIGILTVLVLLYPTSESHLAPDSPLPIRVVSDPSEHWDAARAAGALASQPLQAAYNTHLSERPVWFAFDSQGQTGSQSVELPSIAQRNAQVSADTVIVLPSRHIQQITCFDAATLAPIGGVSPDRAAFGALSRSGSGIALNTSGIAAVICRTVFSGPAVLSALQTSAEALKRSNDTFYRRSGLLEGGLATLAVFVLITALVNRDWVYVLFAAWLFGNLRLGAISMGWDDQWLGYPIPIGWISLVRKITVPVYYILTGTLFQALFRSDLTLVGFPRLFRAVMYLGPVLLVASIVLPVPLYLPLMWAIVSFGIAVVAFLLVRLLKVVPSRTALWYSAALGVALLASLSEVVTAIFKARLLIPALNSVTAALVSSLMAALAIAEQIRAERAKRVQAEAELRHAYEATPIGLFTLGTDGRFIRSNPALKAMLNMPLTKAGHWDDYFEVDSWREVFRLALEKGEAEIELSRAITSPRQASLSTPSDEPGDKTGSKGEDEGSVPLADALTADLPSRRYYLIKVAHAGTQLEGSVQDTTERNQATETLNFLADHDPLTGALNRRGIDKFFAERIAKHGTAASPHAMSARADTPASPTNAAALIIGYLDLDRFKLINDLFGHHIGDGLLKQVCTRIESSPGSTKKIGRIGGDEFVILFYDMSISQAAEAAQAMIDNIDQALFRIGHRAFHVRASLGLIEAPGRLEPDEAISAADSACRQAKRNGNGRVVVYAGDAPMFGERARELTLIERFSGDLPTEWLFLEMQPIMSMRAPYDALDFEVLLRMRDPDGGGVISPVRVIAAAEANGTISALDKWVLETTLTWIDANQRHLTHTAFVSVNVSGASLNDEHFVADLDALLLRYRHVVHLLCIEITEGVALHDLDNTRRLVDNVQRLGAKIALDDFGAGYTSFAYLRDLPADALKIDGGFVRNIHELSANGAIVEAVVGLARNLGMQSVAEWVEDAATLELLQSMRVDYVQGYAIARPQSPAAILAATSAADFITDPKILELIGPRDLEPSIDLFAPRSVH